MRINRLYNLDGLRFFSALIVVLAHIESFKSLHFNLPTYYEKSFFFNGGSIAVIFFFVLSGFLITYLLMEEKNARHKEGKNISIMQFYRNRVLRIWPLYYTLILFVFFLLPNIQFFQIEKHNEDFLSAISFQHFLIYSIFCPNLSGYFFGNVIYLGQLWSLGVEEFFYLFFPLGIYFFRLKDYLKYFAAIVLASFILAEIPRITSSFQNPPERISLANMYLTTYWLYTFGFGAIAAYCFIHFQRTLKLNNLLKYSKLTAHLLLLLTTILVLKGQTFYSITPIIYSILFSALIFCLSVSGVKINVLNSPVVVYLGKISYGIYLLHPLTIVIGIKLFYVDTGDSVLNTIILDIIVVLLTILISSISYQFLEKPFLKLRVKREYVSARNLASNKIET